MLRAQGLTINTSQEAYHDTIAQGLVISQNPGAGTELNKGDTISVVISKGKEEIPPKAFNKVVTIPYQTLGSRAGE